MIDPFGLVLALIRADTAVAAITTSISSEAVTPPCVVLSDDAASRRPFGPGSGRLGLQSWLGFARCYGADSPTGAITARQLAGAVSDSLDDRGVAKDGTRMKLRSYAPDIDGQDRDPDTRWPFYAVRIEAYLAREAIA